MIFDQAFFDYLENHSGFELIYFQSKSFFYNQGSNSNSFITVWYVARRQTIERLSAGHGKINCCSTNQLWEFAIN